MSLDTADLEAKKAEWIAIQLDIAKQAVFSDHSLSFSVADAPPATPDASNEVLVPTRHHVQGTIQGLHTVGGLDISFFKDVPDEAVAALTVLSLPELKIIHTIIRKIHLDAPYIPSFLSMREAPHFVALIDELRTSRPEQVPFPQVFLVDGNGRLHERQAGLATVVGVQAGVATIGCAKDYHPPGFANSDVPEWRKSQKGFKGNCKGILRERGDWLGIVNEAISDYVGAVRTTYRGMR